MNPKFDLPKELADKVIQVIQDIRSSGKIRKGTNEATKSVERNEAKFVAIAADVNPVEIIMHIPMLCDEKKIPFAWVPTKADLGAAAGLPVGTSAIAVANAGEAGKKLAQIVEQINILRGIKPETAAKPAAPKAEAKPAEEKKEPKKPRAPRKPKEAQPAEAKPAEVAPAVTA
jgi:ribosomal protein eL8